MTLPSRNSTSRLFSNNRDQNQPVIHTLVPLSPTFNAIPSPIAARHVSVLQQLNAEAVSGRYLITTISPGISLIPPEQALRDPAIPQLVTANRSSTVEPRKYKTQLCKNWLRTGVCVYDINCIYAHGSQELRKEIDNITTISLVSKPSASMQDPEVTQSLSAQPRLSGEANAVLNRNDSDVLQNMLLRLEKLENETAALRTCLLKLMSAFQKLSDEGKI